MMRSSLCLAVKKIKKKEEEMILTVALPEISEELLIEILTRLPVKTLMRFKCVSNLWLSLITSRYFTDLFLKSSSRRRFFAYLMDEVTKIKYALLASSTDDDHSDTSVSVIDQDLAMPRTEGCIVSAARGLACFRIRKSLRICNLHTRQVVELPVMISETIGNKNMRNYFGHDPVNDEYKVLSVVWDFTKEERAMRMEHQVLVLGAGASWRKIQCNIPHCTDSEAITINGVLYYGARIDADRLVVMSFDLSSEEFNLIELTNVVRSFWHWSWNSLINYKGKLALFFYTSDLCDGIFEVWVLEDAKKSQWLEQKAFVLPVSRMEFFLRDHQRMGGTSGSGTVWFKKGHVKLNQLPTRFFIYDLERNDSTQSIEMRPLRGKTTNPLVSTFWDDIENIMYLEI